MTVEAVISIGNEVGGTEKLGTANGAVELLAGVILRAGLNLGAAFGIKW